MSGTQTNDDPRRLPAPSRGMRAAATAVFFLLGAGLTWIVVADPLGLGLLPGGGGASTEAVAADAGEAPTIYRCPMHPEVVQDHPGTCPICGMPLEPVEGTGDGAVIEIDPAQVQTIGVVTEPVRVADIARVSRTVGVLDYDAAELAWVTTKIAGWIEAVHVDYVGQAVRAGEPLFEIYSPELVASQEEYLRSLTYLETMRATGRPAVVRQAEDLLRAARERLRSFDVSEAQVERLTETREVPRRIVVASPADGVVAEVMQESLEGMYVRPGMNLYRIANLSSVWLHAAVYEGDVGWVRPGLDARVTFADGAAAPRSGTVLYLYPEVSAATRTLKVCVELDNPDDALRPGMYAEVAIQGPVIHDATVIPESAVLRDDRGEVVFVALGEGRFEPRTVTTGISGADDTLRVLSGLVPGELVVTQAQFLLDSESRMREAIAKYRTGRP